ncbi:MAG: hypothetical protein LBV06_07095 [Propionibacteriaceae bacterium]|jgi:hypothetical protein|nr:hypothetical protein [Propionibacteriaceae bacterium]
MSNNPGAVFQKIDPWINDDDDIAAVGGMPKYLYIEGLLYIRRNIHGRDGIIPKYALGEIGKDIPARDKHAKTLVQVGLWIDHKDYWEVRNWTRWNKTEDERKALSEQKRVSGQKGAHAKWHSAAKPDPGCRWCVEKEWARA